MKKIYLLSLLCLLGFSAFSQPVTVTIWAHTVAAGTFITGNSTATTRTDNTIVTTAATQRGYAVFDLSGIPAGSVVNSVTIGFYLSTYGGAGVASGWNTYGYAGDLSTVTVPGTLFADMVAGTSLSTATYGAAAGNQTLPSTAASTLFVQNNEGSKVSICFTGGATRIYTIIGETGNVTTVTTANHAPFLTVTYCPPPTGVSASAAPTLLCEGDMLTLTSIATGASGGYSWSGPGGYSSGVASPSFTASVVSAGVYTLTAVNSCVTYSATATATTASVTVNPLPSAITGASDVCTGNATTLSSGPPGGNWASSDGTIASIGSTSGVVIGSSPGFVTITYTLGTGCFVSLPFSVNAPPAPIGGPAAVCVGNTITLTDLIGGGTWTSSLPGTAAVDPVSGIVTGSSAGTATITYTTGGCAPVTYDITVNPLPSPIGGPTTVCVGSTITETETTLGGTWSSSSFTTAFVGTTGVVTGVSSGSANIIYTLTSTGCQVMQAIVVNPLPVAIAGPTSVCVGSSITLTDAMPGGSFSGGAPFATVLAGGLVTGNSTGIANVTYTETATVCSVTTNITVNPKPSPISGTPIVCQNATIVLSDSDPGGTWSSGATILATVGSTTGIVTGIATPGAPIIYTLPTGCSATVAVTVNPAPLSVITPVGSTTFCAGNSVLLNATAGPNTYQWYLGGTPITGATNSSYTASTSGSITVDVTNTFGCTTTSAATIITAGITTTINYSTSLNFCIGSNIILTANTGGAVGAITYQWLRNGLAIAGGNSINYSATTSGVYKCAVNISGGSGSCLDTSAPVTVVVNQLPTPTISYTGTMLTTASTYAGYQWFLNTVSIPGANSYSLIPPTNGSYVVRASDGIGCSGFSSPVVVYNAGGVGVNQLNKADVKIYPNPASDVIHIASAVAVRAVITGIEGKILLEDNNAHDMNIGGLANGLYIIMLYDENGERLMVQKLIKQQQ